MESQWIKITAPQMMVIGVLIVMVLCVVGCVACTAMGMLPTALLAATPMP